MKILYANGDSWTAGDEFPTNTPMESIKRYYETWPNILAHLMEIPITVNEALPGGSNHRIYRKTLDFIFSYIGKKKDPKDLCIVIGWTTPERSEVYLNNEYYSVTVNNHYCKEVYDYEVYKKIFYTHMTDEEAISIQVRKMLNLRMLCNSLMIKFYDFIALGYDPEVYNKVSLDTYNIPLLNLYTKHTWHKYAHDNNHALHPNRHPTAESNKLWAEVLFKELI